jgi:N-acetyltransferase
VKLDIPEIAGKRVNLLPLAKEHLIPLFEAAKCEEIWTYLPIKVRIVEDMIRLIDEALEAKKQGTEFPFVVYDQETKKIVGMTRLLNISLPNRSLEIGWTWYSSSVWRTHVNTECKFLLLNYCFQKLNSVRVQFKADSRNHRSNIAIQRIGAKQEGILRMDRVMEDGYIRNTVYHSIIEEEWPSIKEKITYMVDNYGVQD